MTGNLTAKQEQFCQEYLIDLNATQAAIRAGYSNKTAGQIGDENLKKPQIAVRIQALTNSRLERTQVHGDYVLRHLIEIDQMDIADILGDRGEVLPVRDWPLPWRRTLSAFDVSEMWDGSGDERKMTGLLKKIKWPDKLRNLELLGKHVAIGAFKEAIDHNHKGVVGTIARRIVDSADSTPTRT